MAAVALVGRPGMAQPPSQDGPPHTPAYSKPRTRAGMNYHALMMRLANPAEQLRPPLPGSPDWEGEARASCPLLRMFFLCTRSEDAAVWRVLVLCHNVSQTAACRPPCSGTAGEPIAELAPGWRALMERCWADDPEARPAFPGAGGGGGDRWWGVHLRQAGPPSPRLWAGSCSAAACTPHDCACPMQTQLTHPPHFNPSIHPEIIRELRAMVSSLKPKRSASTGGLAPPPAGERQQA